MGMRVRGKATARPEKAGDPTLVFQELDRGRGRSRCHEGREKHMSCQRRSRVFPVFCGVWLPPGVFNFARRAAFRLRSIRCCSPGLDPIPPAPKLHAAEELP